MPTVLIKDGFRFHFYSHEGTEPPHVHVQYGRATVKFWLSPVVLASVQGMKVKDLSSAMKIVKGNEKLFKDKWNEFFKTTQRR